MTTSGDSANIVYRIVAEGLGLPTSQSGNDTSHSSEEHVVVHAHKQERSKHYMKNYIEANVVVPDLDGEAQSGKLKGYEREVQKLFYGDLVGEQDGTAYVIELQSLGIEKDDALKSHYVNCKLLFSALI